MQKILSCLLVLTTFGAASARVVVADTPACNPKTPLETVYCQIQARGEGGDLPALYEFRKNPDVTQALLLKRGAQKLGLVLPVPKAKKPVSAAVAIPAEAPASGRAPAPPLKSASPAVSATAAKTQTKMPVAKPPQGDLAGCVLKGELITCGQQRYDLQFNVPNRLLAAGALTRSNTLRFPPAPKPGQEPEYLATSYAIYIDKMLAIGLAAATLTYGKFSGIYAEVNRQQVDFGARFARMYEFLQEDKRLQQAPKRFTQVLPQSLAQCWRLSANIIICDDQGVNWIYRSSSN